MSARLRTHISSNVIALVALFSSLSGVSTAANAVGRTT